MGNCVSAFFLCASLFLVVSSQSLPYNPTTILLPRNSVKSPDVAYVFIQDSTDSAHQFVAINISTTLSPSDIVLETRPSDLSFLKNDSTAFIPSINSLGEVSVYTGSCSNSSSSELWKYTPSNSSTDWNGVWTKQTINTASDVTASSPPGADFLAKSFDFSTLVYGNTSQTDIYVFGGMCPSNTSNSSTWQSEATYSNHMLRLGPTVSADSMTTYTLDLTSSRGPPIAEAGFTITGLTPTYSNGSGAETQQQNFVLVGGHTHSAFINMSQVAIWSLPEESWSFITVDSPGTSGNTELAIKSTVTMVDSRSGHTAVLSEDGASIIVYGGWVGDIGQAAEPQLAILNLGTGFGGSGDWKWTIPADQPSGGGMYGHGAAILPGNVMMVLGGYNISTSATSKRAINSGIQAMFYNVTNGGWVSNYTNPNSVAAVASSTNTLSKTNAIKLGLGLGIGFGGAAILAAVIIGCWYSRHLKRKRIREYNIREMSLGAANSPDSYHSPTREVGLGGGRGGGFPWTGGRWNGANPHYDNAREDSNSDIGSYENLSTGVHGLGQISAVPSPPRQVTRKPLHSTKARGSYQQTPTFDFNLGNRSNSLGTAGQIHPIYEADEEESIHLSIRPDPSNVGVALGDPSNPPQLKIDTSNRHSDPFKDPFKDPPSANFSTASGKVTRSGRSHSVSDIESPAQSREREIQEWVSDWAAADALLTSQSNQVARTGRISPVRRAQVVAASTISSHSGEEDGRTASNLSEKSMAPSSHVTISRSGSSSQGTRTSSLRGLINTMIPFSTSTVLSSSAGPSTVYSPVFDSPPALKGRRNSNTLHPPGSSGSGNSAKSFNTAKTSFPALQAEGESLLFRSGEDTPLSPNEHSPSRSSHQVARGGNPNPNIIVLDAPSSPSKSRRLSLGKGRAGWLGSLRRVFAGEDESKISAPYTDYVSSRDVSPVRPNENDELLSPQPRRAVSASATLWRRKQGREDWDDSATVPSPGFRRSSYMDGGGETSGADFGSSRGGTMGSEFADEDEDEWDIERAVENRVVQVMFTVPKEKLRVVNHDFVPGENDSETGSKAGSRGGSVRSKVGSVIGSLRSKSGSGKRSLREVLGVESVIEERREREFMLARSEERERERNEKDKEVEEHLMELDDDEREDLHDSLLHPAPVFDSEKEVVHMPSHDLLLHEAAMQMNQDVGGQYHDRKPQQDSEVSSEGGIMNKSDLERRIEQMVNRDRDRERSSPVGKKRDRVELLSERDRQRTVQPGREGSPVSRKSKVLEMVEKMEGRNSPVKDW